MEFMSNINAESKGVNTLTPFLYRLRIRLWRSVCCL